MKHILLIASYLLAFTFISYANISGNDFDFGKVMEKPAIYDDAVNLNQIDFFKEEKKRLKDVPWIVFIDRTDCYTSKIPKTGQVKFKDVFFRESYYVVDEEGEWIRIIQTNFTNLKGTKILDEDVLDFGWIKKRNILLWNNAIRTQSWSKAKLKAFPVSPKRKITIPMYISPLQVYPEDEKGINEGQFYYVIKEDEKSNRVLLVHVNSLSQKNAKESIIGWVKREDVVYWDNKLGLEPKHSKTAFFNRLKNKRGRVVGFKNVKDTEKHITTNQIGNSLYWDDDPTLVDKEKSDITAEDYRLSLNKMRFPFLNHPSLYQREKYFVTLGNKETENGQPNMEAICIRLGNMYNLDFPLDYSINMSRQELSEHLKFIEKILAISEAEYGKKERKLIQELLFEQMDMVTSNYFREKSRQENFSNKYYKQFYEKATNWDYTRIVLGINKNAIPPKIEYIVDINKIENKKLFPPEKLEEWFEHLYQIQVYISELLDSSDTSKNMKLSNGRTYYWIPLNSFF